MSSPVIRTRRGGFTLVELMVVIAIIATLVTLLLPAINYARRNMTDLRCRSDLDQLNQAVQAFKSNYSIPYFPSKIRLRNDMVYFSSPGVPRQDQLDLDSINYLKRLWPRLLTGSTPGTPVINWCPLNDPNASGNSVYVLEGDQCLVFFLGGIQSGNSCLGFAASPTNPMDTTMVGAGRKTGPFFEFPVERLAFLNHTGFPDLSGSPWPRFSGAQAQRTQRFLSFVDVYGTGKPGISPYIQQRGALPYLYFSATDRGNDYSVYGTGSAVFGDCPSALVGNAQLNTTQAVRPYLTTANKYANDTGFQIISAGYEGRYGPGQAAPSPFPYQFGWAGPTGAYDNAPQKDPIDPSAPYPGRDNMSNFHPTKLGAPQ